MNETDDEKLQEARNLKDFYIELMDNSKTYIKYYFSDDVILDWFGQTIKGQKKVAAFLKDKVAPVKHFFTEVKPVNRIGFRDTHVIKPPRFPRRNLRSFMSPPRQPEIKSQHKTPKKQSQASSSNSISKTQEDNKNDEYLATAAKKIKFAQESESDSEVLEGENDINDAKVKCLTTEGYVEFHRSSIKKLQSETKWTRPCKLHIAYSCGRDVKDSTIYLIIYEGNMKCRRNLLKDFESEEPEN